MKIVYLVLDSNRISGGNRVIFEQVNRLKNRGHNIEIWSATQPEEPPFICEVPIYYYLNSQSSDILDILVITDPNFIPEAFQKFQAKDYFFLVQHDLEMITELNRDDEYLKIVKMAFQKFPDKYAVICTSSWLQKILRDRYKKESVVISCGIDLNIFNSAPPLFKSVNPIIVFCYDIQIWKGTDDAISAINIIKQKYPNATIVIIGSLMPFLSDAQSHRYGWFFPWPVIYFHRPTQNSLASVYSSADVFISSSWYEGFGLPGLEAMACGVPVVTTDSGGAREYAINEENCLMVPSKNPQALADAVMRVLNDKPLRDKLIKNGLQKAKELDWEKSIDKLEKVFMGNH